MTKIIARLGAVLGFESKDFVNGVNEAQKKSKEFKQSLKDLEKTAEGLKTAFGVASAAFVGFATHAIHAANEIQDLANANETTTGKILELRHALSVSGGDADKVGTLFTSFTTAINDAAQGSDKLRDSFKAIGITTHDLGFLSSDELRNKAITGLAKIDDVTRRNALAMEMFGKAARNVDMKNLAAVAEESAGHYKNQEEAIKAAAEAAEKMKQIFHDIETAALLAVKPVVDLFNKIPTEDRVEALTKAFQALGVAMGVAFGVTAVKGVIQLGNAMRALVLTNPWLLALSAAAGIAGYLGMDKLFGGAPEHGEEAPELKDDKAAQRRKLELSSRDKMVIKYQEEIKLVKELAKQQKINSELNQYYSEREIELEGKKYLLSQKQYDDAKLHLDASKQRLAVELDRSKQLYEAQKQLELAPAEEQHMAKLLYDTKVKYINELSTLEKQNISQLEILRQKNLDAEYERQRSWVAGWNEAFKEYQEAAERAADRGKAAFNLVVNRMEDALKNFVETGKLDFKSLTSSIIKDLIYMEMKAQATQLFGLFRGAIMGSSLFGSSPNAPIVEGIGGHASGGYMDRPSIVGENGPELFIPRTAGTVIPNGSWQQMAGNRGGMTVNGPYIANLSTIDSKSFEQRIYESNKAVWSAGKYAEKSLMSSGGRT